MNINKRGGVVGDLISGTGGLIILTIVVLVVISTLLGASLLSEDTTTLTLAVVNETATGLVNTTGTSAVSGSAVAGFLSPLVVTTVHNSSNGFVLPTANYTAGATGTLVNKTTITFPYEVNVSYTYYWTGTDTEWTNVSERMGTNFTAGIDNISGKLPTILLIGAVVLLFGVIVLLVKQSGAMGIGGGRASL